MVKSRRETSSCGVCGVRQPDRDGGHRNSRVAAKGGDFDFVAVAGNKNDAELRADSEAVGKKLHDALGSSVGGDVVIGGLAPEQEVAHTAADQQGLVAIAMERSQIELASSRECTS